MRASRQVREVVVQVLSFRERLDEIGGELSSEVCRVFLLEPSVDAPVGDWVVWHERLADVYDRIAVDGAGAWSAGGAAWLAEWHRCEVKRLDEHDPDGRTGR
jgi:hypothetical protein